MKNTEQDWYQLDNAAKIFPGQNSRTWSNVFRVGVELHEKVQPEKLRTSVYKLINRMKNASGPGFDYPGYGGICSVRYSPGDMPFSV